MGEPAVIPETATGAAVPSRLSADPARFERQVFALESDDVHLAKGVAAMYADYREAKYYPRTHRKFRAKARLLLRRNVPLLHRIASELYYNRIFVYQPQASAQGVGDN
jgi:hypothetical protein